MGNSRTRVKRVSLRTITVHIVSPISDLARAPFDVVDYNVQQGFRVITLLRTFGRR